MAAIHSYGKLYDNSLDDLPSWKKNLILRKRANSKAYNINDVQGTGGTIGALGEISSTSPTPNYVRSQPGLSQLSSCSGKGPQDLECSIRGPQHSMTSRTLAIGSQRRVCASSSVQDFETSGYHEKNCVSENGAYLVNVGSRATKYPDMHHKGRFNKSCRVTSAPSTTKEFSLAEESEFEYGPGIVSRLKDRYLSLAMRESRTRASLRKYSSLEDLLDEGPAWQNRGRSTAKTRAIAGTPPVRREIMKRTRSMDSLALRRVDSVESKIPKSHSSGGIRPAPFEALAKEVIIIEAPKVDKEPCILGKSSESDVLTRKTSFSLVDEEEMPPPDTVKQVKQIFESAPTAAVKSSRGTAARVAAYKASQASKKTNRPIGQKPAIKAKPKFLNSTVEEVRSSLKQVPLKGRSVPRSTLRLKANPLQNGSTHSKSPSPPVLAGLTPVSASVTSPLVNGDLKFDSADVSDELGIKDEPESVISNIRKDPPACNNFDLTDHSNIREPSSARQHSRPLSPIPTTLPPSPTLSHRVGVPPTFKENCDSMKENQRVLQENKKNAEKSNLKPFKEIHCNNNKKQALTILGGGGVGDKPPPCEEESSSPIIEKLYPLNPVAQASESRVPSELVNSTQEEVQAAPPSSNPRGLREEYIIRTAAATPPAAGSDSKQTNPPPVQQQENNNPKPSKAKEQRWHQQENNTLVFNFAKRAETPDYIENDGVDLSKRRHMQHETSGYVIMPGYDGRLDSSTDGDDPEDETFDGKPPPQSSGGSPAPCHITFIGEGVIINGRSNLQRQPRNKKLEISFDMVSTKIYEYPSEDSLLQDSSSAEGDQKTPQSSSSVTGLMSHSSGLASYTPSKLMLNDTFELGISRPTAAVHPPTPPRERPPPLEDDNEYLRPANEAETITWSSHESVPDLLF